MLPLKLTKTQHLRFKIFIYVVLVCSIATAGWDTYKQWLNPLNMKVEENPKQHDGSQEFNPHQEWESAIQPAPDEDGVRRYLDPYQLHHHGKETEPSTDEIVVTPEDDSLIGFPDIGLDN